jgi:hypothetical protein
MRGLTGLAVLGTILVSTAVLADPVSIILVGSMLIVAARVGVGMFIRFVLIRRACELANNVPDLVLALGDRGLTGGWRNHLARRPELAPPGRPDAFWPALTGDERDILLSLGRQRTFHIGEILLYENARAGHVLIILDGWTKVSTGGRVIAERGPGQIIGERAALRVSVRSASVVALEDVRALVLNTGDFAQFIAARPHVLPILENQIYERLVEPDHDPQPEQPATFTGENCTVLFTDVASFATPIRTDEDRLVVRDTQFDAVRSAFAEGGLGGLDQCHWEDRGDGLMIIVPPSVPTRTVLESVAPRLALSLQRHNRRSAEAVRIKLRLAVHVGPVTSDHIGVSGEAIIHTARILEADAFKRGLAASDACLGVVTSSFVFDSFVRHSVDALSAHEYREISSRVKESTITAWMRLTGQLVPVSVP